MSKLFPQKKKTVIDITPSPFSPSPSPPNIVRTSMSILETTTEDCVARFHEITDKWIREHRQEYRGNRYCTVLYCTVLYCTVL